jgi:hypothetical protein
MPKFDYRAARSAGWSDDEIAAFLDEENKKGNDLYLDAGDFKTPEKKSVSGFASNMLSSGLNFVKDTASGLANIFNPNLEKNTLMNVGKVAVGAAQKVIPGKQKQEENFDALVGFFKNRYGSVDALTETAYNDPVGFLSDISTVLTAGGAAVSKAGTVAKANKVAKAGQTAAKVGNAIDPINAVTKTASAASRVAKETVGATTGAGYGAIQEGLNAAEQGGNAQQAFTGAMRNAGSGESFLGRAKEAFSVVKSNRAKAYRSQLEAIKESSAVDTIVGTNAQLDVTPVRTKLSQSLGDFKIRRVVNDEGEIDLDFSRSTIADPAEQAKVRRIYQDVQTWDDFSPVGVDTLKRRIANEFSQTSDVRAIVQGVKAETSKLLKEKVPGYEKLVADYEEASDFIDDIQKNLSLGDKASVDTGIRKLTSVMRQNNEFRMELLKQLESASDTNLTAEIAGTALSPALPRGIIRPIIAGGSILGGISFGAMAQAFPALLAASPRVVGEFINAIGTGRRMVNKTGVKKVLPTVRRAGYQVERATSQNSRQ